MIAEEVATATSDVPWTADDFELVKVVMRANRDIHNLGNETKSVKSETKESEKKKTEPFINQVFGHDRSAIEGFKDCENKLQKNLDLKRAERNAATEFKGAVKTEKVADAQKSDGNEGDRPEEKTNLDSREADNEGEDHFCRPEFSEMDAGLRERAKRVYQKLKATIKVIPFPSQNGAKQSWKLLSIMTFVPTHTSPPTIRRAFARTRREWITVSKGLDLRSNSSVK